MTEEMKQRLESSIVQISCETCRHWKQKPPSKACRACIRNRKNDLGDMWEPSEGTEKYLAKWQQENMKRGNLPEERLRIAEGEENGNGNQGFAAQNIPQYLRARADGQFIGQTDLWGG